MSALSKQVAGTHYKNQKIQPIELTYMLGQTPAFCKVCKYATRIKDDPIQQLNKALHCIELDSDLAHYHDFYIRVPESFAVEKIREFTEDKLLQKVLECMHLHHYTAATRYMKQMIKREKEF
ncbi:hypothetical protein NVP1084O_076 [Vibrio phage 1.084.O._10N.261.49.F5]|nr:hypothetical protein NVP1084O_076 [Vibrio phage 1.084.O._10N.261.49.F5]